jgi:hypothetical protein
MLYNVTSKNKNFNNVKSALVVSIGSYNDE